LNEIYRILPKWENSPIPALIGYLPPDGLIPNSERYLLGPISLERFEPRISPSTVAFHLGSEGQLGRYKTAKGDLTLAVFNYPTPNLARERFEEFRKLPGAVVKRTGPLVALAMNPPDPDAAERLLGHIRYEAAVTANEPIRQNFNTGLSNMILSIFALAGIFIGMSIIAGVGFGGFRALRRKLGRAEPEPFTLMHLHDRRPRV
jgi:hypothetical protein